MLRWSDFDEKERLRVDHPDLVVLQNLSPVQNGEQAKVIRLIWQGTPYILKHLTSSYEYDVMQWVAGHGVPVPQVVDFIELATSSYVLLEDIGSHTLERSPELVPDVVDWMIQVHQMCLPNGKGSEASFTTGLHKIDARPVVDTFQSRKQEVLAVPDSGWERIWDRWFTDPTEQRILERAIMIAREAYLTMTIHPFSHGDLHPNNVAIRSNGSCCLLDWEFAGCQSIFTDVYALLDMCYPDAKAYRYAYQVNQHLTYYASRMDLDSEWFIRDYQMYRLLNHVREVVCCYRDVCSQTRDAVSLTLQVEWIKHQLSQEVLEVVA